MTLLVPGIFVHWTTRWSVWRRNNINRQIRNLVNTFFVQRDFLQFKTCFCGIVLFRYFLGNYWYYNSFVIFSFCFSLKSNNNKTMRVRVHTHCLSHLHTELDSYYWYNLLSMYFTWLCLVDKREHYWTINALTNNTFTI